MPRVKPEETRNAASRAPARPSSGFAPDSESAAQFLELTAGGVWRCDVTPSVSVKLPPRELAAAVLARGRLAYCNAALARLFGLSDPCELIGSPIGRLLVGQTDDERLDLVEGIVRAGFRARNLEVAIPGDQGRTVWTLNNTAAIVRRGRIFGAWGTALDITDWKSVADAAREANDRLRTSEERLALALSSASDGAYDVDLETGEAHYSPGYYTMLGYAPGEFAPSQAAWESLLHPEDRGRVVELLTDYLAGRAEAYEAEFRLRQKSGEWRWIASKGRIVARDAQGRPLRLVGTHRDVTGRVRAREALRRERDLAQLYLDTAEVMLVVLDPGGTITLINRKGCRLLGYESPADLLGRDWFETCLPPEAREMTRTVFQRICAGDVEPVEHYENPVLTRSGECRDIAWHNALVRDAGGGVVGVLSSGEDITERRRAEAALERTVTLLSQSEEASHVGSWEKELGAGGHLVWSDELFRIFGLEPQEFQPNDDMFLRILPPDEVEIVREAYERAIAAGLGSFEIEHRVVRPRTGEERHVREKCVIVRDSVRVPTRAFGIVEDVTDKLRAEKALRESEAQFRSIFESSPVGMVTTGSDYRFTSANPAFCRMIGYREDELRRLTFVDVTHPDHADADLAGIAKAARGEVGTYRTVKRYVRKDGATVWASVASSPMRDAEGRVQHYLAVVEDISAAKEAQAALAESERKYRELANDLPTCVFETDRDGRLTYANQTGLTLFGYAEEDIRGMQIASMVVPEERALALRTFASAWSSGDVPSGEYRALRKDGATFPALVSARAIYRDGKAVGMRGILVDITERVESSRRIERALAGTIHALAVTTEMRDPYTAGHQERVTRLALAIGRKMGLDEHQLAGLRVAGLLHDVGKVSVPAEILNKPTELTTIEMGLVQTHSEMGYAILREIDFPWPVAPAILQHHERMDGSGYPAGLRGDKILLEARILAVADSVEAMASHRPYRAAVGLEAALGDIENGSGTLYDEEVVSACLRVYTEDGFSFDA